MPVKVKSHRQIFQVIYDVSILRVVFIVDVPFIFEAVFIFWVVFILGVGKRSVVFFGGGVKKILFDFFLSNIV